MSALHDKLPAEHTIDELTRLRVQVLESLRQTRELIRVLDKLLPEPIEPTPEQPPPVS
jgi:hypothetical protein